MILLSFRPTPTNVGGVEESLNLRKISLTIYLPLLVFKGSLHFVPTFVGTPVGMTEIKNAPLKGAFCFFF